MIALRTTADWQGCTLTLDDGLGPKVWTPGASVTDAYAAIEDFCTWFVANFAAATATWTWMRDTAALPVMTVAIRPNCTVVANTTATAVLGATTSGGPVSDVVWSAPSGAVMPLRHGAPTPASAYPGALQQVDVNATFAAVAHWRRSVDGASRAAGTGAPRRSPATSHYRPRIEWAEDDAGLVRLQTSIAAARNPRTAVVWDDTETAWRTVSIGAVTIDPSSPGKMRARAEVLG